MRVLIACRGASAARVIRGVSEAGMESVALVSARDEEASWALNADYVVVIENETASFSMEEVVSAAMDSGCDVIHPGWGEWSRCSDFVIQGLMAHMRVIGPGKDVLGMVINRPATRRLAQRLQIPVVPGSEPIHEISDASEWIARTGFPALIKSTDGSGASRSFQVTSTQEAFDQVAASLSTGSVYLERRVVSARELTVLIVGDGDGEALTLGEQETSIQHHRRRMVIESPAPDLDPGLARMLRHQAATLISTLSFQGLASVRFLLTPDSRGYFLQVIPGLMPWSGVSEMTLGIDIVDAQLRMVSGEKLGWNPADLAIRGHTLCLRIFATGTQEETITGLTLPEGAGVRVDWGFAEGDHVNPGEDLGAIVIQEPTRQAAIVRAKAALDDLKIHGVQTNLLLLRRLFDLPEFWRGALDRDQVASLLA